MSVTTLNRIVALVMIHFRFDVLLWSWLSVAARLLGDSDRAGSCLGLSDGFTKAAQPVLNMTKRGLGCCSGSRHDLGPDEAASPSSTLQGYNPIGSPSLSVAQRKTQKDASLSVSEHVLCKA